MTWQIPSLLSFFLKLVGNRMDRSSAKCCANQRTNRWSHKGGVRPLASRLCRREKGGLTECEKLPIADSVFPKCHERTLNIYVGFPFFLHDLIC